MSDDETKSEILEVVETDEAVYFLRIDYEEGDIADALGFVFRTGDTREETPEQVLSTNETLRSLWASPTGALWTASSSGSVGTTAKVRWPKPKSGADYLTLGASPKWSATDLPRAKATKLPPNITALWGIDDSDVYAGTYDGDIYRWNGVVWAQVFEGEGDGHGTIRAFGGVKNDVYAVGIDLVLLHFDGTAWQRLRVPDPPNEDEGFTAVHRESDGSILVSGSGEQGRLLHGSAAGLAELGRYSIDLIDMAALGDRVLFATGNGVAELFDAEVRMIKSNLAAASVSAGKGRLFFIDMEQELPGFIEYDPRHGDDAWWGIEF